MLAVVKINKRAKQLSKRYPTAKWSWCVKKAAEEHNAEKEKKTKKRVGGVKRGKKKRRVSGAGKMVKFKTPKRVTNVTHYAGGMVGSISQHKNAAKKLIAEKLGWLDVQIISAKTARQKNALKKRRAQYMSEARALS